MSPTDAHRPAPAATRSRTSPSPGRRRGLVLAVCVLALSTALAGCTGSTSQGPAVGEQNDSGVVTRPDDYSYLDNVTGADRWHVHDYWEGEDRRVVLERSDTCGCTWGGDEPIQVADVRGDTGEVVPQGASRVEVTVSWETTGTSTYAPPELWVRTAADDEPQMVQTVENGETVTLETTNDMNDLPHQVLSAWVFQLRAVRDDGVLPMHWDGETTFHVEAFRGLDIPAFPPHPDLWDGADELVVLDQTRTTLYRGNPENGNWAVFMGEAPWPHTPQQGAVVPFDAGRVAVSITRTDSVPDNPTRGGLSTHGADTREFVRPQPESDDGTTRIYDVPVTNVMGDGPYALQSLWEFAVHPDEPRDDEWYWGSYRIHVTAHRGDR